MRKFNHDKALAKVNADLQRAGLPEIESGFGVSQDPFTLYTLHSSVGVVRGFAKRNETADKPNTRAGLKLAFHRAVALHVAKAKGQRRRLNGKAFTFAGMA